jgi:transposase
VGYHCVFNLILRVLYTGMQWKCLPIPQDTNGKPAIHDTTVYKVFARWADDGSLWQAFIASVGQLAAEKHLCDRDVERSMSGMLSRVSTPGPRYEKRREARNTALEPG